VDRKKETGQMNDGSGSTAVLGVIVGALLVGVVLLFVFVGVPWVNGGGDADLEVSIEAPAPQ
jgi:hypothetical protein